MWSLRARMNRRETSGAPVGRNGAIARAEEVLRGVNPGSSFAFGRLSAPPPARHP